jgi:hypothetical protein
MIKDTDIETVSRMPDVEGEDEQELEEDWDSILL